ncbi:Crp/Fnr family transcriptional regulator [Lampropedia aestuarii]|uniref:Crp/Fnr family transcriptional regulator n=1 Tax=Lampropedia aestuarii TaxID=2562762 RepID=UPI002468AFA1|nr:Crp/Fnr family transcriptional regulator [Lampropedia aestuarii]MDH5856569.1 Crp/Fnr family transcriptional regulator [Lampropedia aestuarii]
MAYTKFDLLQWMEPELSRAFVAKLRKRLYRPGQLIYQQGSPGTEMFRLVSGHVRISVLRPDGKHITYTLFEPGDCFGQTSLVDHEPRPQTTEASTAVEVGVLSRSAFVQLSTEFPSFDRTIMRLLSAQLRVVSHSYEGASLDAVTVRVARQILAVHRGLPSSDATANATGSAACASSTVRLSQSELAAMVGASRQSVNKALQAFQQHGWIRIDYGGITVLDAAGIQQACNSQ